MALGGRGGQDIIRSDCPEAKVRAEFRLAADCPACQAFDAADGILVVERVIRHGGGSLSVNGKAVTAQAVRQSLAPLVDFAAQNEHMRLAETSHQRELLDAYGKLEGKLVRYQERFREAEGLRQRLRAGREERELVRIRLERAKGDLDDLLKIEFAPATDLQLEDDIREMSHAAAVVQAAAEATARMEEGEPSVLDNLAAAWRGLEKMLAVSPRLAQASQLLGEALEKTEAALAILGDIPGDVEASPDRLDAMIARSEKLKTMARRFSCRIEDLDAVKEKLQQDIAEWSEWDVGEEETRKKLHAVLPSVIKAGKELGKSRREAAAHLAKAVNKELAGLGMEQAGFEVAFEPLWSDGMEPEEVLDAGAFGLDEINFFISPNPGEPASAIAGAASGGESSRAVLALKAALSEVYSPDLMFLDEIDSGVGARLGRELGVKLQTLAERRQVVVITHLPQIAAAAGNHLFVAKKVKNGRTTATVNRLTGDDRVKEIASMIHGSAAGELTRKQAKEMLKEAGGMR